MTDPVADANACTTSFRRLAVLTPNDDGSYDVGMQVAGISVHDWLDERGLKTPAWTYGGAMPGDVIEVARGQETTVRYHNDIASDAPTPFAAALDPDGDDDDAGATLTNHAHGAWILSGLEPAFVTHLHGAEVAAIYDGNPGVTAPTPHRGTQVGIYPNEQRAALHWFHDHSMPQTAGTVYAGLAAPYVIRDEHEHRLVREAGLPVGLRELFLVVQDKGFERDGDGALTGRFTYHVEPNKEWAGEHFLVNGRLRPSLAVDQQPHRVRLLNATNGRSIKLYLRRGDDNGTLTVAPIVWIGSDGGFLPEAIPADPGQGVFLTTANRADLVIDFAALEPGPWTLVNRIFETLEPYGNGDLDTSDEADIDVLMQFEVTPSSEPYRPFTPPDRLAGDIMSRGELLAAIDASKIAPRDVPMDLTEIEGPPLMQLINGVGFHAPLIPDREQFRAGEWIRLNIRNTTEDAHPIHVHLVSFWVVGRSEAAFTPTQETGLLDTAWCPPGSDQNDVTSIVFQLPDKPDLRGRYMFHCHILEHEDHDMMRPFVVLASE